jgi:hypothetical protein
MRDAAEVADRHHPSGSQGSTDRSRISGTRSRASSMRARNVRARRAYSMAYAATRSDADGGHSFSRKRSGAGRKLNLSKVPLKGASGETILAACERSRFVHPSPDRAFGSWARRIKDRCQVSFNTKEYQKPCFLGTPRLADMGAFAPHFPHPGQNGGKKCIPLRSAVTAVSTITFAGQIHQVQTLTGKCSIRLPRRVRAPKTWHVQARLLQSRDLATIVGDARS